MGQQKTVTNIPVAPTFSDAAARGGEHRIFLPLDRNAPPTFIYLDQLVVTTLSIHGNKARKSLTREKRENKW